MNRLILNAHLLTKKLLKTISKSFLITLMFSLSVHAANEVSQVSAGENHTLAIKSDGTLWAWGNNLYGQVGNGKSGYGKSGDQSSNVISLLPEQIGSDSWLKASSGDRYSLAIKSDGTLWAWGINIKGQLGNDSNVTSVVPVQIGTDSWLEVKAGYDHSLAIKSDGTLWAWGSNTGGQLGDGTNTDRSVPAQIGTDNWLEISAGAYYSSAINSDGTLWAWGSNFYGQLGNGSNGNNEGSSVPAQIGTDTWLKVSAGRQHVLSIKSDGTLWAWGNGYLGRLGNGSDENRKIPTQIGIESWTKISAGMLHSLSIKSDGTLWAWGYNRTGELGDGTSNNSNVPLLISGNDRFQEISAGSRFSLAIKSDENLWASGWNTTGQLGYGNLIDQNTLQFVLVANTFPKAVESFESGYLNGSWQQRPDSDGSWKIDTTQPNDGFKSLKADTITDDQSSSIVFTGEFDIGGIDFDFKVDSEPTHDNFVFYIDDEEIFRSSGVQDWSKASSTTGKLGLCIQQAGEHTLRWEYSKDNSISSDIDSVWIDALELNDTPIDCAPVISVENTLNVYTEDASGVAKTDERIQAYLLSAIATDIQDGDLTVIHTTLPDVLPIGTTAITFSVTDSEGNLMEVDAEITVIRLERTQLIDLLRITTNAENISIGTLTPKLEVIGTLNGDNSFCISYQGDEAIDASGNGDSYDITVGCSYRVTGYSSTNEEYFTKPLITFTPQSTTDTSSFTREIDIRLATVEVTMTFTAELDGDGDGDNDIEIDGIPIADIIPDNEINEEGETCLEYIGVDAAAEPNGDGQIYYLTPNCSYNLTAYASIDREVFNEETRVINNVQEREEYTFGGGVGLVTVGINAIVKAVLDENGNLENLLTAEFYLKDRAKGYEYTYKTNNGGFNFDVIRADNIDFNIYDTSSTFITSIDGSVSVPDAGSNTEIGPFSFVPNFPPVFENVPEASISVDEKQSYSFTLTSSDSNNTDTYQNDPDNNITTKDILIYSIVSGPSWLSLAGDDSDTLIGTPQQPDVFNSPSTVEISVDDGTDSTTYSFTITVVNVNDTPIASNLGKTTNEDESVDIILSGSDIDNDNLIYTLKTDPSAGSLVAVSNSTYTYSPNPNFNGTDNFTYFVNDGTEDSADATVTINVTAVNDMPTTRSITHPDTNEDALVTLSLLGSDIDNDNDTLIYNIVSQPIHGSLSSVSDNQVTYTPNANYFGGDSFTYQVNDGFLDSNVSTVTFNLLAVNDIPQITSEVTDIGIVIDTLYSYTVNAVDVDNDELSYSSNTLPTWLTLSGNVLSGTPVEADIGSYDITLTVSDVDTSSPVSQSYTITVRLSNSAPTFTGLIDVTTNEDEGYELVLTASDAEGDTFTFDNVGALPSWLALNGDTLSGTPTNEDVGVHLVNLSVKDTINTTEQSFTITVANINDAPVFTSTEVTQATEGLLYNYLLAASDVDSDTTLTFSADNLPSWLSLTDNTLSGTPVDSDVGSANITVSVSDNTVSIEQTFTITVLDNGIVGLSIVAPDDITMEANALMTQVNLGAAVILDDVDTNLQGSVDNPGPYGVGANTVTWSVTDSDDNTQTDTQTVTITDTTAPDLGQPSEVIVNSVGYYSDLSKLISLTGVDLVEGEIAASLMSESSLLPGRHDVLWQVSDSQNNNAQVSQSVVILPQVTLGGTYLAEIGAVVSIPVTLNADAADYPVLINIDVVGKDIAGNLINLPAQDIVINEGQQGHVELDLVNVGAEDSIELTLVSASNATLGHITTAFITLVSTNITPQVMLESVQSGEVRTSLFKDQGSVTINADIMDVNINDTHTITWDSELTNTSAAETAFSFDPSLVEEGNYTLTATVTETNTTESHSVSLEVSVNVFTTTPTLQTNQDSDGDGINDDLEGLGDSDGDGIADYVDNNQDTSQLPIGEGNERLQTAVGITLSLGNYIRKGLGIDATMGSMSALDFIALANNDNAQLAFTPVTPVIDFVMSGLTQVGNAVSVIIPLPLEITLPANAQYMKYQSTTGWTAFVDEGQNTIASAPLTSEGQCPVIGDSTYQSGLVEGTSCIELTLVDGGTYDDDGLVNGQISDPAIISANYAPTISIDGVSAVDEQMLVTLNASGVDPEGEALTYQWAQTAGETVILTGENEASVSFTSPDVTSDSNLSFSVTVSDGVNITTQATTVMVVWIPKDLSITATSSAVSINEGGQITLDGSASIDPDGYSLSYQWSQVSGPSVTLSSPANATSGFTAPQVTSDSAVVVRLTISQGSRETSTDLSITVSNVAVVTPPTTPAKESGGGGAINLYWLMMLLLISLWRVKGVSVKPR